MHQQIFMQQRLPAVATEWKWQTIVNCGTYR